MGGTGTPWFSLVSPWGTGGEAGVVGEHVKTEKSEQPAEPSQRYDFSVSERQILVEIEVPVLRASTVLSDVLFDECPES